MMKIFDHDHVGYDDHDDNADDHAGCDDDNFQCGATRSAATFLYRNKIETR